MPIPPPVLQAASSADKEEKLKEELLKSLCFSEMYDRQHSIWPALSNTIDWIFTSSNYIARADRINIAKHHGLLWIKGKPGAVKSTLMKAAFLQTQTQQDEAGKSIAAFFFNARGAQVLERSPVGLYRSLLHQILKQDPGTLSHLSKLFASRVESGIRTPERGK